MKVSQMIYTACGKERKGDFSTWSKTSDITIDECRCIETVMSYRNKPVDMPYVPTEEDIKKFCPKKYAYFVLNSGRKCLAQTNYVSNVYSDLDKRLGNFVIHAFIFDELDEGITPFDLFNCKQFKDALSYKEWHDDPIPESLPELEITPFDCKISDSDMKAIFASYKPGIVSFIQALLNGVSDENYIVLDAKDEDLPALYHIASLFLSKEQKRDLTFSNLFLLANDYTFKMSGVKCIRVRSLYHGDKRPVDFTMPEAQGNLIFSFLSNKFTNVEVSLYLEKLVALFESVPSKEFVKRLEEINALKDRIREDGVTTIAVLNFLAKKYELLDLNFNEYNRLLDIVLRNNLQDEKEALLDAYKFGFASEKWLPLTEQTLPLLRKIYPLLSEQNKVSALEILLKDLDRFVDPSLNPESYLNRFKETIFSYDDYVKIYLKKPFQVGEYKQNFFALGALIYALSKGLGDKNVHWTNVRTIFMSSMRKHELGEVKSLLNYVEANLDGSFNREWAYKYIYLYSIEAKNKEGKDISLYNESSDTPTLSFGFDVLSLVDASQKEEYLFKFINKALKNPRFLDLYLSRRKEGGAFDEIESRNERFFFDNIYKKFIPTTLSENYVNDAFNHIDDVLENLRLEYLELLVDSVYKMKDFVFIYINQKQRRESLFTRYEVSHGEWVYNNLYLALIPASNASKDEIEVVFRAAKSLSEEMRVKYLMTAFEKLNSNGAFMALYIKNSEIDPHFYEKLERELKNNYKEEFEQFNKRKSSSQFAERTDVDDRALERYFNEHYKKNEDAGAYIKQLEKYLDRLLADRKEKFLQYVFERLIPSFKGVEDDFLDMMDIYALIENRFYSIELSFLLDKFDVNRRGEMLKSLNDKLVAHSKPVSGKYEVLLILYKIKNRRVQEEVKEDRLYKGLSDKQIAFVFDEGLEKLLICYFETRRDRNSDILKHFPVFFKEPFMKCANLEKILRDYLDVKFRDRYANFFFTDLIIYSLLSEENDLQKLTKNFMDDYLDKMSDEKLAKRAIEDALSRVGGKKDPKGEKIYKYLEAFEASHKKKPFWKR